MMSEERRAEIMARGRAPGAAAPTPVPRPKPRLSFDELARIKGCPERKARGLPCQPPRMVLVPQPPALALTPTRPRALVTVVVGAEAEAMFAVSGPLMRAYADRVGADFIVLDWPGVGADWPMSCKLGVAPVLDHYERIIYADADVLFRPGCVDLFGLCGPDEFGACDELPFHRQRPQFKREAEHRAFRREMGLADVPALPWVVNCGVMVVPRGHKHLLLPPGRPIPASHCAEQDWIGAGLLDSALPYRLLDRRGNWQAWTGPDFVSAPADAVLHFSGMRGRERLDAMRRHAAAGAGAYTSTCDGYGAAR